MEQLLKILEDNARLPIEDIATMLNKSPAEVAAMIDLARALMMPCARALSLIHI